jgi:uncharacterized protein
MQINQLRQYSDDWAFDLSKNMFSLGELKNIDVINQSIEMILSTSYGERIFNSSFGCNLQNALFENLTQSSGEKIIDDAVEAIKRWEDRIIILEDQIQLVINQDTNSMVFNIPYVIKASGKKSFFKKKIIN